jgi:hypothetical protein
MQGPDPRARRAGGRPRTDVGCLALLFVVALALRAWEVTHTEVAARDSVGYIRIAWQLRHGDWHRVLPASAQHPLYPLAVLAASGPVRHFVPDDLPRAMQLSAQLASSMCGVLLVVPMYYLGRELFNRRVAFGAALLFQCLPAGGRVLGDGLSEALFLLLAATALWAAARGLRGRSSLPFSLAGLFGGLAYLTRPEGLLVPAAAGLVLLGVQAVARWRRPWASLLECSAALTLATLAVAGPYMAVIKNLTVKNTVHMMVEDRPVGPPPGAEAAPGRATLRAGWDAPLLGDWLENHDLSHVQRRGWAVRAVGTALVKGFFYAVWVPALVGLWVTRGRFRAVPGMWVIVLLAALLTPALFRVAVVGGYLSDRHALLLIFCGCYWAAAGTEFLAARLARAAARRWPGRAWSRRPALAWGMLLLLCGLPLAETLKPLHPDRSGFRSAGYWLAAHAWPGDHIDDTYAWASFYAGAVFREVRPELGLPWGPSPAQQPPVRYVVFERSDNPHSRHKIEPEDELRRQGGRIEKEWLVRRGKQRAEVVVWSVPLPPTPPGGSNPPPP